MSSCRPPPTPTTSAIRRSGTSASGCWTGWPGSGSAWLDGFEGNAQTFRILTELEVHGPGDEGLNLTAAVRAAVLKYPVGPPARARSASRPPGRRRPAAPGTAGRAPGAAKFSAYSIDLAEMQAALAAFPDLPPGRQTLECSVMDLADDIAYSLHDVEDFHRSGVLQFSPVSGEFRSWATDRSGFAELDDQQRLAELGRQPGAGLERLRRRLLHAGTTGCSTRRRSPSGRHRRRRVRRRGAGQPVRRVDGRRPGHLRLHLALDRPPDRPRSAPTPRPGGPLRLRPHELPAWHEVQVLKFVNQYFILDRPDLAMFQRGQEQTIEQLVVGFDDWLSDRSDAARAPRRLARPGERGDVRLPAGREDPSGVARRRRSRDAELARMGRGRGIVDFVSSLTDAQAVAFAARLAGASGLLWTTAPSEPGSD